MFLLRLGFVPATSSPMLNARRREADLEKLAQGFELDLLVIGGGITGAGVALDAVSRGMSVALLERRDLATGTSRWSSKLIHGGLRYLAKAQVGVAWEAARERALLMQTVAPHLIGPLPFLTPLNDDLSRPKELATRAGLHGGNALRAASGLSKSILPGPKRIGPAAALELAPGLKRQGLRGALVHWDGQLEDDARLVVAVARTAASFGARIVTYTEVQSVERGVAHARDARSGKEFDVRARCIVNATGVWAGSLAPSVELKPSRGTHIVFEHGAFGDLRATVTVPLPGSFGRYVFAMPRPDGEVVVGLTDDPFDGEIVDAPLPGPGDEAFLLDCLNNALEVSLGPRDVKGTYAGLRPLLQGAGASADLSRRHALTEDPVNGVLTIAGGKLTTYRKMAQDTVDLASEKLAGSWSRCTTHELPLVGAPTNSNAEPTAVAVPDRLNRRYGSEAADLVALAQDNPALLDPLVPGLPVLGVELIFGARAELALTLDDLLERRTRLGLIPSQKAAALVPAKALMSGIMG